MKGAQVKGFDYTLGKEVTLSRLEWQAKYPSPAFRRVAENGETAYYVLRGTGRDETRASRRVAEAYAIIPEAK